MSLDCVRQANEQALSGCVAEYITTTSIRIVVREYEGRAGDGTYAEEEIAVLDHYPVREISDREVASSGGLYESGDIKVEMITKPFTVGLVTGGYTDAQLRPASNFDPRDNSKRVFYIATGDINGFYSLIALHSDDVVAWSMVLRRTRER